MSNNFEDSLPNTRTEQLFYCYKYYFSLISFIGIMTFLFALPLIFYSIIYINQFYTYINEVEQSYSKIVSFGALMTLFFIPLFMIFSIGLSGAFYVSNRLTSDMVVNTKSFFTGIKENFLMFLLIFFIYGLSFYFFIFNTFYFPFFASNNITTILKIISIIQFVFFTVFTCVEVCQINKYKLKVKEYIKNGFILSLTGLVGNLGIISLILLPIPFLFLFGNVGSLITIAIIFLFYNGFLIMVIQERFQYIFDEKINKINLPDQYRRGLKR